MATVQFFHRKKVLADGTSPLVLKIYKDGKPSISHTDVRLFHKDWDPKKRRVRNTHLNADKLNKLLIKKLADAKDKAIDGETINHNISAKAIINKIKPKCKVTFFSYAAADAKALEKAGNYPQMNSSIASAIHFRKFLGTNDILFTDITVTLLERYKDYLANEVRIGKKQKNMAPTTVLNNLSFVRRIFNDAMEAKDVEEKFYPFGKTGMELKAPETAKDGLTIADVKAIESVELTNPKYNHARNLWLISFYFGGMRASDVLRLKWSDFRGNRLHYTMGKNKKTGSVMIVKSIVEKVSDILAQYESGKRGPNDFIFPDLKELPSLTNKIEVKKFLSIRVSAISTLLRNYVASKAGLIHKLTMHIARHTFGNISAETNIDILTLQKIFRHSSVLTTLNYMKNFIHKETDEAMEAVLNFEPVNIGKSKSTSTLQLVG